MMQTKMNATIAVVTPCMVMNHCIVSRSRLRLPAPAGAAECSPRREPAGEQPAVRSAREARKNPYAPPGLLSHTCMSIPAARAAGYILPPLPGLGGLRFVLSHQPADFLWQRGVVDEDVERLVGPTDLR